MAKQPEDFVSVVLREIQAALSDQTRLLNDHTLRFDRLEKQLGDLTKIVTYSLGQSTETQFRQSQQESRLDDLLAQLEKLRSDKQPV